MSAVDLPVAAAMVDLQRSQGRWPLILFCVLAINSGFQGVIQHGPLRWLQFGLVALMDKLWSVSCPHATCGSQTGP
jgi:hypothetical protein